MLECAESDAGHRDRDPEVPISRTARSTRPARSSGATAPGELRPRRRPGTFPYEFRREVDYGSAAALMVRADFWREVGGFDERSCRCTTRTPTSASRRASAAAGIYEPRANVVHLEGGTPARTSQRPQAPPGEQPRKFVEKWRAAAAEQPAAGSDLRRAANRARGPPVLIVDHRVPYLGPRLRVAADEGHDRGAARARLSRSRCCPTTSSARQPYGRELQRMGVEVCAAT